MKINARIAGIIDGNPVNAEGAVELKDGATLKKFFKRADKEMGFKQKYFKKSLKQPVTPTVLINGDRAQLPEDMKRKLEEGDEISVVLPMSGG